MKKVSCGLTDVITEYKTSTLIKYNLLQDSKGFSEDGAFFGFNFRLFSLSIILKLN